MQNIPFLTKATGESGPKAASGRVRCEVMGLICDAYLRVVGWALALSDFDPASTDREAIGPAMQPFEGMQVSCCDRGRGAG